MGARVEDQLPVGRRLLAAGGAAFVAATIVNPLDVVKVRLLALQRLCALPTHPS
jgi:hypothetical protein